MDSECKSRDVLQSYFDLLGELMKFNVDAFKRFNKYINTDAKVGLPRTLCTQGSVLLAAAPAFHEPACPYPGLVTQLEESGIQWDSQASSQTLRLLG